MTASLRRGLYVHIPFCRNKCHYCDFVITANANDALRENYFSALEKEIIRSHEIFGPLKFDTVYLGGGTPSSLSLSEMQKLFELLSRYFSWNRDAEITCEINPGEVGVQSLKSYNSFGINRLSIGVQSFNDTILKNIGRIHDVAAVRRAFDDMHAASFKNISADLIIRLPRQTLDDVEYALRETVACGAQQLVIYDLTVHPQTAFGQWQKEKKLFLPQEDEHWNMAQAVEKILTEENNFAQYEISSFAKSGFESRHNLIYWHNQEYLGLGPGAFSYMNGKREVFARSVGSYLEKIKSNDWTFDESEKISPETQEIETLMTGLRLKEGVDVSRFSLIREHLNQEIPRLVEEKLVEWNGDRLLLTRRGKYLAESVFSELSL